MFRWAKGIYGSGLPRATKGMLPLGSDPQKCPCDFDAFTAWEGHQIVGSFYPPISTGVMDVKIVRQLARYPYDVEDGELLFEDSSPFATTTHTSEVISEDVNTTEPIFNSALPEGNANALEELDYAGSLQPGTLTVDWVSGGAPQTTSDDGAGAWTTVPGTVDYCTPSLVLDLITLPPDPLTDILLTYDVMDQVTISTRLSGTVEGGIATAVGGLFVGLTQWTGFVQNNELTVVTTAYSVGGAANIYYLSVDSDGVINHNTTIQIGETLLCRVETDGFNVIDGPFDMRLLLNMDTTSDGDLKTTRRDTTDFWYYGFFVYTPITLAWHHCTTRDYALIYDSTVLFEWLWNHLPRDWRTDDSTTPQRVLTELTHTDGQVLNINEEGGKLRGQLYRFLKWFGIELERGRAYTRAIATLYLNVDRAPPPVLQLLAELVGITIPKSWDLMRQRAHVKGATYLWQRKGTEEAITIAAYRATGILPDGLMEMHERLLYSNMLAGTVYTIDRTSLDTTLAGGSETLTDPHSYAYGPERTAHYHERGLNIFFTDPASVLTDAYTHTLLKRVLAPATQPIYRSQEAETPQNGIHAPIIEDYFIPGSVTLYWRSGAAPGVLMSMTDDGQGGFLAAGDGNPAGSSVNYLTKELVLDTRGNTPTLNTEMSMAYTSSSGGAFQRLRREVENSSAGTAHIAYYVDSQLLRG